MENENKKKCFVITPIGNEFDPIRRHIDGILDEAIIPVLEKKYDIDVSHRMSNIGEISKQILEAIYSSDLVVANLTNLNPNVMYELSFRHSTGKPAIIIAEEDTKLPFDLLYNRTIFYKNDPRGMKELRDKLNDTINSNDLSKSNFGPIFEMLKGIEFDKQINDLIKQSSDENKDIIGILNQKMNAMDKKMDVIIRRTEGYRDEKITSNKGFETGDDYKFISMIEVFIENEIESFFKKVNDMSRSEIEKRNADLSEEMEKLNESLINSDISYDKKKKLSFKLGKAEGLILRSLKERVPN